MQDPIINQLNTLNRQFYDTFADAFAASRGRTEPGLERALAHVVAGARVLDLGCGHGRVALLLPEGCLYTGMDYSEAMLAVARRQAEEAGLWAEFVAGDLLAEAWPTQVSGPYDWIVLRAVLHHIPTFANRCRIIEHAKRHLAPDGRILMANWQFLEIPRLRRRLLDWDTIGLTPEDVEPGDYLLDWQRDGYGLRYVHLVDEAETQHLAQATGLHLDQLYRADGHNNNLTLYAILRMSESMNQRMSESANP